MRNLFLITVALIAGAFHSFAGSSYGTQWKMANMLYQMRVYDSAAAYYEEIASHKPRNAELYYNLGNTYYRLNRIGPAVLNYERALRIKPDYKEAKDNLLLAQHRMSSNIPEVPDIFFVRWWDSVTAAGNATAWALSALITFLVVIVLLLLQKLKKLSTPVQLKGVLIFVFLCLIALAVFSARNSMKNSGAVVMTADAPMMKSRMTGKPLTLLPEGTIVKIKEEKGDLFQIRIPDGRTGWVQKSMVSKI
jgi:Tetratricopeptide repeat